ncbi:P-loop containing nucleoside triphosphate hydrolase protein [Ceratobasidium sp. AG-I]|nr:P-loop containing nucleoside triphosphate hydrolase protein [Ceratobasidium sp. AG-I]
MLQNTLRTGSKINLSKYPYSLQTARTLFTQSSSQSEHRGSFDLGGPSARPARPNSTPRPAGRERYRTDDLERKDYARRDSYRRDDSYGSRNTSRSYQVRDDARYNDGYTSKDATQYDRASYGRDSYDRRDRERARPDDFSNGSRPRISLPRTPAAIPPVARPEDLLELIQAIRTIFPHVKNPTPIQAELIPAIHQGSDVLLMDETGSGKTFGSVLALLSEARQPHAGITTLFIVPHRDLAYQIQSWCETLLSSGSSTARSYVHAQVLARPDVDSQLRSIRQTPPRILITTPGGLTDALKSNGHQLHNTLRRIVVDEVDAVMNIPMRYKKPRKSREHRAEAALAVDQLLLRMWRERRAKPQMILMSATLRTHVRAWLFSQNGWLAERVVRLDRFKDKQDGGDQEDGKEGRPISIHSGQVVHAAVAVEADGTLRNVALENNEGSISEGERGILTHDPELVWEAMTGRADATNNGKPTSSSSANLATKASIPPSVLEAIATSVALDVSNRAMLVVPTGFSVAPVVESLRELGVEARLLNLHGEIEHISQHAGSEPLQQRPSSSPAAPPEAAQTGDTLLDMGTEMNSSPPLPRPDTNPYTNSEPSSNPTLLVTTVAAARGLDIPTLSHIYIVGGLQSEEVYRHIAGRVGRFGMSGKVVSFVSADGAENIVGGSTGERRLKVFYKQIGAKQVPFVHIQ